MIADALHAEIQSYSTRTRRSNPLFRKAADGTLTADHVARYLANVLHLLRHTPVFLAHARERALEVGDAKLAEHFAHKDAEEKGHDLWAERDVKRIAPRAPNANRRIVPAIEELIAFTMDIINEDPSLILSYMFFNESLMVILGDDWLALLEKRCGIPRTSMTVVGNHVELDRDHMDEALECIDNLVGDPRKLPRMHAVLLEAMDIFDRLSQQLTENDDGRDSVRDAVHAPAA